MSRADLMAIAADLVRLAVEIEHTPEREDGERVRLIGLRVKALADALPNPSRPTPPPSAPPMPYRCTDPDCRVGGRRVDRDPCRACCKEMKRRQSAPPSPPESAPLTREQAIRACAMAARRVLPWISGDDSEPNTATLREVALVLSGTPTGMQHYDNAVLAEARNHPALAASPALRRGKP